MSTIRENVFSADPVTMGLSVVINPSNGFLLVREFQDSWNFKETDPVDGFVFVVHL